MKDSCIVHIISDFVRPMHLDSVVLGRKACFQKMGQTAFLFTCVDLEGGYLIANAVQG